jgi:hypothetical protein
MVRIDSTGAVADLTTAYSVPGLTSLQREVRIADGGAVVRDDLRCTRPVTVTWAMHTRAAVTVARDGRRALLTSGGKALIAAVQSPAEARFLVEDVTFSPPQRQENGERKLLMRVTAPAGDTQVTVAFDKEHRLP